MKTEMEMEMEMKMKMKTKMKMKMMARLHPSEPIFSVRVSQDCRALGVRKGNAMIWFWIGWHADYERLLRRR